MADAQEGVNCDRSGHPDGVTNLPQDVSGVVGCVDMPAILLARKNYSLMR